MRPFWQKTSWCNFRLGVYHCCYSTYISEKAIKDDSLLVFASRHYSPCVFMQKGDPTVSLKSKIQQSTSVERYTRYTRQDRKRYY